MLTYPFTPSQIQNASAEDLLAFIKSPTMVARRFSEIIAAQQFIGLFLFSGRLNIEGGAIAVPANEQIRTVRGAEKVAPGGEYKLTPLNVDQLELWTAAMDGIATEVTDVSVGRLLRQPIDDAFTLLQTELVFTQNETALGVAQSSITQTITGSAWTTGKQVYKDALRVKAAARRLKLGYSIDTAVLPSEQYAEVIPELLDVLPKDSDQVLTDGFPTIAGITWVSDDGDDLSDPIFLDRRRFGAIGREKIPSPEYRQIGGDTGVEIASTRNIENGDKTRLQARAPQIPVVLNPLAGFVVSGTD